MPNAMPTRVLVFFSYGELQYCEPIICLVLYIWCISLDVAVSKMKPKGLYEDSGSMLDMKNYSKETSLL